MAAVRLRETESVDLDIVIAAERDEENRRFVIPWTRQQHAGTLDDPDCVHRIVERVPDEQTVGFMLLAGLASPHRSLEFRRLVIVDKRQGYGRAAVRAVKQLAFEQLRAHRLWLDVMQFNHRARRLYESEGFVVEGILRECLLGENGFDSLVVMSMLESEYRR